MLRKFLNIVNVIVFSTPVLMAGVSFEALAEGKAEKQIKPNIHQLTNEKTAKKVNDDIPEEAPTRIPGELNKHSFGIGFGQTFLRSSLAENGNDKITGELYYNYSASYSFDFMANAHWSTHTYLNRESTIRGLALAIKGKGYQLDAFAPYVFGGFGFYYPSAKRYINSTDLVETRSQVVFGVNAGAGVELRLNSKVIIGAILHYHDPFDVRQEIGPTLQASYLKLLITALYTFN
jgi:opacity protein-like surface antigen